MNGLLLLLITLGDIVLLVLSIRNWDAATRERVDARVEASPELKSFEFSDEELRLMPGQKLQAIKLVRERTGLNLRDAHSVVDYHSRHPNK